ncbi:patatin-like phospholipase family protein [Kibdelosporangium persicum]|uniref:Phospholipase n=1 Tax=Kibdelosporangium persicum TaxID=2698649 RepID=A0ABX2FEQ5_9PSEU|nr:patatin-like phospholipase family protein [Kibdelosporangium persicum]NRN69863.1 Phospholipase [Kibdelosporangium persicum]
MRALVLGGGGVAGIAWEVGILYGLGDAVLDVDVIVGTSAGSAVAATVTQISLAEAYERQITPAPPSANGPRPAPQLGKLMELFGETYSLPEQEAVRKMADFSLAAETMPEETFQRVIGSGLPSGQWPDRNISVVAYDTGSGERTVFTRESGVDLVPAVAASCSVPGVFPPITINGRRYMDGGIRMSNNADLVAHCDEILIIAPLTELSPPPNAKVISPDQDAIAAMGANVLDPASRIPSAEAGLRQGRAMTV